MDTLNHPTTLDFNPEILAAQKTTHLETNLASATIQEGNLFVEIGQQRLETYRIFPDTLLVNSITNTLAGMLINIYPNPASSDKLNIEIHDYKTPVILKIYNAKGQLIITENLKSRINHLDLNNYPTGIYLFSFESERKNSIKKVVITH